MYSISALEPAMRLHRPADAAAPRPHSRGMAARALIYVLAGLLLVTRPARAQWILEGIADGEAWVTDARSTLLTRNDGHPAALGRLHLWTAAEPLPGLYLFALGEVETGQATPEGGTEVFLDQLGVRYQRSHALVLEVGKLPSPVGIFAGRRFSTHNPLIGTPDGYPTTYPWGVQLSGALGRVDYRGALVSLPVSNEKYLPHPGPAARLALGAGIAPLVGLRLGGSFTRGPYLNGDLAPLLPAGRGWRDYAQQIVAFDGRFSRGYLELIGELSFSKYDVPNHSDPVPGTAYYVEAIYTWTPRLFTALRFEQNDYAFVRPIDPSLWIGRKVNVYDGEVGVGVRLDAGTTVKVSYRRDFWDVDPDLRSFLRDGHAVALQISRHFDVRSWLTPRR